MMTRTQRWLVGIPALALAAVLAPVGSAAAAGGGQTAGTASATLADTVPALTLAGGPNRLQDVFNSECMDGRLGVGNLDLATCGVDGTHQEWVTVAFPGDPNGAFIQNVFNGECIDGRLGVGNLDLATCGVDGTHQDWHVITFAGDPAGGRLQDVFNGECMDGRLGVGNLDLATCGVDGTHQDWHVIP